jgi:hypothetical protein
MVVKLNNGQECNVSFANNFAKFTNWTNQKLLVEWYKNEEFYGSMEIPSNSWGAMPMEEIDVWKINIPEELSYTNILENKDVLINATLESKNSILELEKFCKKARSKYECNIHVYIKNSHLLKLKPLSYQTLKLNYPIQQMALGLNKTF